MKAPGESSMNVIPLTPVEDIPAHGEALREAVLEALNDLLIERVPEGQRSPYFQQGRDLLTQAGWSPEELLEAAEPGPRREELWDVLELRGPE